MKRIIGWQDFRQFGIHSLTGEACAIGARVLCDVTEEGRRNICLALGLPHDTEFKENWNADAVGSILLPYGMMQELAAVLLIADGASIVIVNSREEVIGIYSEDYYRFRDRDMDDSPVSLIEQCEGIKRSYRKISGPTAGMSALHAMSGRSA